MLLAYLDEVGQTGAFVHPSDSRYSDSPAFGYAGFIIDESVARSFSGYFLSLKSVTFASEIPHTSAAQRWEKKGANLLYAKVPEENKNNLRILGRLLRKLKDLDGAIFYYAAEKPVGTPKETNCGKREFAQREEAAMQETLNRLARYAHRQNKRLLVLMDQINEKERRQRLPLMYAHIYGRAANHPEMRRIVEPPMHIDSQVSSNIQFADWVAALVKRAVDNQLVADSRYKWVPDAVRSFMPSILEPEVITFESKLHLHGGEKSGIHNAAIFSGISHAYFGGMDEETRAKLDRIYRAARDSSTRDL